MSGFGVFRKLLSSTEADLLAADLLAADTDFALCISS